MNRKRAIAVTAGLCCAGCLLVLGLLGDGWYCFSGVPQGRELRAALAVRDNVTPFQKWGTRVFTWRYLTRYYDRAWYFTQSGEDDAKAAFVAALDEALTRYPNVDLFLLAHTNKYVGWVAELPEERRQHLRFVYNTGCHNEKQGARWLELGAKTYIGHPGVSWSSIFYYFFLREWTRGGTLADATADCNRLMERTLRQYEWATLGYYDAAAVMRESVASCVGNTGLRLEDCAR